MNLPASATARLKMLEGRRLKLIERSGAQRQRLCADLDATFRPPLLRNIVRNAVHGALATFLLRKAMVAPPLSSPLPISPRLARLTWGAWLAYRAFTAVRGSLTR